MPALPTGMHSASISPSASSISNAAVFWPSRRNGLTRVDERDRVALGELAHELERLVEVAAQGDHPRAVHQRLGELAGGDLALRDDHRAGQAGAGGVGGGARGGVAGGRADRRPRRPRAPRADTAQVIPRSLNEPVGFAPSIFSHTSAPARSDTPLGQHERRRALLQRDDRVVRARTAAARGSARSGPWLGELLVDARGSRAARSARRPSARSAARRRRSATRAAGAGPSPAAPGRPGRAARRDLIERALHARAPRRPGRARRAGRRPPCAGRTPTRRRRRRAARSVVSGVEAGGIIAEIDVARARRWRSAGRPRRGRTA